MRNYTVLCVFPHAEIHAKMCISAWGNTLENVYLRRCGVIFSEAVTRINEFPHAEMQAVMCKSQMRIYTILRVFMWKYTWKCVFPHVEIHTDKCNTACGNTLNTAHFYT